MSVSPSTEAPGSGFLPIQTVYSSNGWDSYSWGFVAEAEVVEISIANPFDDKEDASCGPVIDSVALVALPPMTAPTAGALIFVFLRNFIVAVVFITTSVPKRVFILDLRVTF